MRLSKKILFTLIILLVAAATVNGIYISMNMGPEVGWFRWVSFLVTISVTAFLSNKGIKELAKIYRTGHLGEFFEFALSLYPRMADGELSENLEQKAVGQIAEQVKAYCLAKVKTFGGISISEITDRPFLIKDNTVRIKKLPPQSLTTNPSEYLLEHFHAKTDRMFIIGPAGMGKSHLLRRYILTLLQEHPEDEVTPIFLPAATYEGTNMTTWILNTCKKLYELQLRPEAIESVLHHGENVCLFIDGVDELPVELRDEFIRKVYTDPVTSKHKLIISCRDRDFGLLREQTSAFSFPVICELQKLEPVAINDIIVRNLPASKARVVNGRIPKNINTPLLISLFTRVAAGSDDAALQKMLTAKEPEAVTDLLWEQHIEMVFSDKKLGTTEAQQRNHEADLDEVVKLSFSLEKIKQYAARLANYRGNQYFTINDIQPKDLTDKWEILAYILSTRLIIGVIVGLGLGFLLGGTTRFIPAGLVCGLVSGIIFFLGNYHFAVQRKKYPWWNRFWRPRERLVDRAPRSVLFFLTLLLLLAPFFMLTGMRRDMGFNGTLAIADSIIALIFTIIFTLVLGISDRQYGLDLDIRLVERNNLRGNAPGAAKSGFYFAIVLSVFVALLSVLFVRFQPDNMFSTWLQDTAEFSGLGGVRFVMSTVLPIAFIIGFLLGLNNHTQQEMNEESRKKQFNINYSVATTVKNTFLFWILSTIIIAVLWGNTSRVMMGHGWDGMNRGIECAIGAGLFIALFWGGNDLIKTGVLRVMLYLRDDIPLQLSNLLRELEVLDIIQRQGAIFSFEHQTLRSFLTKEEEDHPISKKTTLGVTLASIILVTAVATGKILVRKDQFWDAPHRGFVISSNHEGIAVARDSLLVTFRNEGTVAVASSGLVSVGRIAGYVSPLGTEAGFFAMPIRDVFDVHSPCRHGSIMYRDEASPNGWNCLFGGQEVPLLGQYRYRATYHDTISVRAGQRLQFGINDLEPENNSQTFFLNFSYVDGTNAREKD